MFCWTNAAVQTTDLGQLDFCASCFQLALNVFCFGFVDAFFDLAASFNEVFGFFEAQTSDAANFFDHVDFLMRQRS